MDEKWQVMRVFLKILWGYGNILEIRMGYGTYFEVCTTTFYEQLLSVLQYIHVPSKKYQYFAKHLLITSVKPSCHLVATVIAKSFSTM